MLTWAVRMCAYLVSCIYIFPHKNYGFSGYVFAGKSPNRPIDRSLVLVCSVLQLDAAIGTNIAQKVCIFAATDSRSFRDHDLHNAIV